MKKSPADIRREVEKMCMDILMAGGFAVLLSIAAYRIGLTDMVISLVILSIILIGALIGWSIAAANYWHAVSLERKQRQSRLRFTKAIQAYAMKQIPQRQEEIFDFEYVDEFELGTDDWLMPELVGGNK